MSDERKSELDNIIPPEIKDDEFYYAIIDLARKEEISTILEIGSSAGGGSTEAFVTGARVNPGKPAMYCMEVSEVRANALKQRYANDEFVHCYQLSSVSIDQFPKPEEVAEFHRRYQTTISQYPVEQVIGWLNQDMRYVLEHNANENGIEKIKRLSGIDTFDLVLIDGSEFTGKAELNQVYGANYILLDDVNAFKNYENYQRLKQDEHYELIQENWTTRNGFAVFKLIGKESVPSVVEASSPRAEQVSINDKKTGQDDLPVHFFTIVLNGEPYISKHIERFLQLPFSWHWHIIEGVADLKHDTAWGLHNGGGITEDIHEKGRSNDGTTEYLDWLQATYPDNVSIYRKPDNVFWDGKREMINAPLSTIKTTCLLWQVDVDELWTVEQISTARKMFIDEPNKTAAFYWCWFFVGMENIVSTRHCYSQNPSFEWLRTWKFEPGMYWAAHEPPVLVMENDNAEQVNVASINPFMHDETEQHGLVFQHYAYAIPQQLWFKEKYYGYHNAMEQWHGLLTDNDYPVTLKKHLAWVTDETKIDRVSNYPLQPMLSNIHMPTIVVDGVLLHMRNAGVVRVWEFLLKSWLQSGFSRYVHVIDRGFTADRIRGINYIDAPAYTGCGEHDRRLLQDICDELEADVFVSTYYSHPVSTPSVLLVHDMIPEIFGWDMSSPVWKEKHQAIEYASAYMSVSNNTADDLYKYFPHVNNKPLYITYNGVGEHFRNSGEERCNAFRQKYGITKPFFMLVGRRENYKNAVQFFKAMELLENSEDFEIVCVGGDSELETELKECQHGSRVHVLSLPENDLVACYSAALALVYPSLYEGFGMPLLEAMSCECPIITCQAGSIPEVAGDAAYYVAANDVTAMLSALQDIQKPEYRKQLAIAGLRRAAHFSWDNMAKIASGLLMEMALQNIKGQTRLHNQALIADTNDSIEATSKHSLPGDEAKLAELNKFAEELYQSGNRQGALEKLNEALSISEHNVDTLNNLAVYYWEGDDASTALAYLGKAYALDQYNKYTVLNLTNLLMAMGEHADAINICQVYLDAKPDDEHVANAFKEITSSSADTNEPVQIEKIDDKVEDREEESNEGLNLRSLAANETLKAYMERAYIADNIKNIFFVGVHLFEEREWFFSLYKNMESIALFEPIPDVYKQLNQAFQYDSRVKVLPYAVSDRVGKVTFNISNNLYSSSLLPMKEHKNIFPDVDMRGEIEVDQVSLQHIIEHSDLEVPDMLYIDVQGAEYMVLTGIDRKLLANVKVIYTEASTVEMYEGARLLDDVVEYLHEDFVFIGFEDMMNTGVHGDALFVNRAFIDEFEASYNEAAKLNEQGEQAFYSSEVDQAHQCFIAAIESWPYNSEFYNNLGILAWQCQDLLTAVKYLRMGYGINPNDDVILKNLAEILKQSGQHEEASRLSATEAKINAQQDRSSSATRLSGTVVSAIVSTYASESFMRECLDDLLSQTIADNIEIVIVDANSPENEKSIVEEYQKQYSNIKYIRTPERIGIYEAWNIAVRNASGKYIISCSTNDRLHREACEQLMRALDDDLEVAIAYGNAFLTPVPHETFEENSVSGTYVWPKYEFNELLSRPMVGPHPMWRKSLHAELGYFDESYKAIGDQEFWLRVGEKYKLKRITKFTTLHWITDDSLSGDKTVSISELQRVHELYSRREQYRQWQKGHSIEEIDAQLMAERMQYTWSSRPAVTFVMYLSTGQEDMLRATMASLELSFYTGWTLKVISELPRPGMLNTSKGSIEWCQVVNDQDLDASLTSMTAMADNDWLSVILPGMEFEAHFLNTFVDHINLNNNIGFVYFDHDLIEADGSYQSPQLKPDFNYDYLLSSDYIGPVCMIKNAVLTEIGGLSRCFGLEHYDMLLKVLAHHDEKSILHIDNILYHVPTQLSRLDTHHYRKELVSDFLQTKKIKANIHDGYLQDTIRVEYLYDHSPLVSIIIPTKDKFDCITGCLNSLLERTQYQNYEVLVIDNQTTDVDSLAYLEDMHNIPDNHVRVLKYPEAFNYAAISNMAAAEANGDYLLFLNNDTKIIQDNWLDRMMSYAMREDVGVVGARLAYPETSDIQHAGVVLGMDGVAGHPYLGNADIKQGGYMGRLQVDQNYSAVTGACMLVKKSVYDAVDGMDAENLKVSYNDVDLCLKIRETGHRIVWTPFATLLHYGNASQIDRAHEQRKQHEDGFRAECQYMMSTWMSEIANDPAYNRHLSLINNSYQVETGVIINWDPVFQDREKIIGMPLFGGSGEYRIRGPLRQIAKAGLAQTECTHAYRFNEQRILRLTELARSGADTVISHAGIAKNSLVTLEEYKKYLDVFKVFTLDDLITNVPEGNNFRKAIPSEPRKRLRNALGFCDRLIVSTEPLADLCHNMINDIQVLPNCLEDDVWAELTSKRGRSNKPRVGWAGAQQHADDLAFIIDVVKETAHEVDWVFFGMCPEEIKDDIAEEHEFVLSFTGYAEKLASLDLDVAIAPLAQHPFNEAKSNLRLLEYGILGWPVICTDIYPYQNAPVKHVQNKKEAWIEAIRERIYDLDAAYQEGDVLQKWVRDNFMLSSNIDAWARALNIKGMDSQHTHARSAVK